MKKKIFIIFLVLILLIAGGVFYLNKVVLPIKIKSLLIKGLQEATQKKVTLDSVQINIFKGLVLRNLNIYDGAETLMSLKEASCAFIIPPIFKKKLVLSNIDLLSPVIFLERRTDNSFNLADLFPQKQAKKDKSEFGIFIRKVNINNGRIDFQDNAVPGTFTKSIDNINAGISLSLPAKISFDFKAIVPGNQAMQISGKGKFNLAAKQLNSEVIIKDLFLQDFSRYYKSRGVSVSGGSIDTFLEIAFNDGLISSHIDAEFKGLIFSRGNLQSRLDSLVSATLKYNLKDRQLGYSGNAKLLQCTVSGLAPIGDIKDISGELRFNNAGLSSDKINAVILDRPFDVKFSLNDFEAPDIALNLSSKDLSLESAFKIDGKLVNLIKLKGSYLGSEFAAGGNLDTSNPALLKADLFGKLSIDLKDIKEPLKKFQRQIEEIRPAGIVGASFTLNGNINDFKSCAVRVDLSSPLISAYGFKFQEFIMHYQQENGLIGIPLMRLSSYGGTIEGNAAMNIAAERLPYTIGLQVDNVKIEKLKMDTPAKDKDISGTIQAQMKFNGYSNDLSRLSGAGRILVSEGRLWGLDLFKGLGRLIFAKEFSNIVFHQGSCGFTVQDRYIFTDNLSLKSNLVELKGTTKIGFDSSLDAAIKVHVLDKAIPLRENFTDVITVIIGKIDAIGIIRISGTLKQPVYKFQPAVVDIIKGLKDTILDNVLDK